MNDAQLLQAAEALWQHLQTDTFFESLPESCRPQTVNDGYAVQQKLFEISGDQLVGWKIAATGQAGQKHISVSHPLAGRLLRSRCFDSGVTFPFGNNNMAVAEAEFAFTMGRNLSSRTGEYSVDEVMNAVQSVHPAIELPDSRFQDFTVAGGPSLIADLACARYFVLGDAVDNGWRDLDLKSCNTKLTINGNTVAEGAGQDVLGGPDIALTWLVNQLSSLDITLHAGEIVTTGVCGKPCPIQAGDRVIAQLAQVGAATLTLSD
ncbi:MAG: fumarylacetoacetate hydrolase family protein [Gammaproteobacteria bacterium]|nr:fumarylacetoacetate hydrolase family protein [Gammaproteobacteria bacterium]